ncbi:glycerate kinase [Lacticaseibacillus zhaodongensis]|uniref:glycerate kinase n=1 Tax=Lacticaseibacillus zhaodongensis TaxID=2668065 RepID=UPI0018AFEE75|nr:glycerate kinase [Lacticaseibacillus zhaodongensis]
MRILIMPDSFKGSLAAVDVAAAMARGIATAMPSATIVQLPVGDGGENTIINLQKPLQLQKVMTTVTGADGRAINAPYYLQVSTQTAFIQAADVVGFADYVGNAEPLQLSTYGIGELLLAARGNGARHAVIALGGSATSDGGLGMLQALGWQVGSKRPFTPDCLPDVTALTAGPDIGMTVTALADVTNPLTGAHGAAHVFGPQKGLTTAQQDWLDAQLTRIYPAATRVVHGAGAAGGLGAAIAGPLHGQIVPGIDYVLDVLHADTELQRADYILTGEGKLDGQSAAGKVISGIKQHAVAVNSQAPIIALCGAVDHAGVQQLGITAAFTIGRGDESHAEMLMHTAANLEYTANQVGRVLQSAN